MADDLGLEPNVDELAARSDALNLIQVPPSPPALLQLAQPAARQASMDSFVVSRPAAGAAPSRAAAKRAKVAAAPGRVAPEPQARFANARLRVTHLYAKHLVALLTRLGTLGGHMILDFEVEAGLRVRQQHAGDAIIADMLVPRAAFAEYRVPATTSFSLFYKQMQALEKTIGDDTASITFIDVGVAPYLDVLCARVHSAKVDAVRSLNLTNGTMSDFPVCPYTTWVYPYRLSMAAGEFSRLVTNCKASNAMFLELTVALATKQLVATVLSENAASGSSYDEHVTLDAIEHVPAAAAAAPPDAYGIESLRIIAALYHVAPVVTLWFGAKDLPMRCEFSPAAAADCPAATINVLLMPRSGDDV